MTTAIPASDLYAKLMKKREEAAGLAQEQADCTSGPAGSAEIEYRARATAFAEIAEMIEDLPAADNNVAKVLVGLVSSLITAGLIAICAGTLRWLA